MLASLKEVVAEGKARKIAIGSFNTPNLECLLAVLDAAEELNVPVIISHAQCHESVAPLDKIGPVMVELAKRSKVKVCVHLDHGEDFTYCKRAIELGFTSVMIDASALPYEENLAVTKQVTEIAHAMGVSVEAELGRLVTGEAGSKEEHTADMKAEDFYTDPAEAKAFCEETGVDALAIAFGTAHGFYTAQPKLDFDVVKNVAAATGLPLVMHGGSGVSEEGFKTAIANGIRKINYYSYMSKAGYMAAKGVMEAGKTSYLHDVEYAAMQAMKEDVKKAIKVFSAK